MAVNRFGHTANSPRAHITNIPAMECFRDIGLETECIEQGSSQQYLLNTRWTHTVLGEEYCRVWAWGNDPARKVSNDGCHVLNCSRIMNWSVLANFWTFLKCTWNRFSSKMHVYMASKSVSTQNSSVLNKRPTMLRQSFTIVLTTTNTQ